jgi:CheY-like chemotaxis protein
VVRLSDALDVETMLLVAMASGTLTVEQAQRQLAAPARGEDKKRRGGSTRAEPLEIASDASTFAVDSVKFEAGARGVVLLIAANGEGRVELGTALARHPEMSGLVASSLGLGLVLAERYRPEVVFLDLGLANVHAFDASRVLSSLTSRAQRRCRVVAGTANVTDAVEKPALMAGAASVALFPFAPNTYQVELDRLEERLGPRKLARR